MTTTPPRTHSYRPSLIFAVGLCLSAAAAVWIDGARLGAIGSPSWRIGSAAAEPLPLRAPQAPGSSDLADARTAWSYFEANTRPETGLVDSTAGYPSATMWDQGSYVLALVSARGLGLIDQAAFATRADRVIASLGKLRLFEGKLPNKAYNTQTLDMVDYANTPMPDGIGWSALDMGRLLLSLRVLERHSPGHGDAIRALIAKWDLSAMIDDGTLAGATRSEGQTEILQEGRLGYEQYAARAAAIWGLDVVSAISAAPVLDWDRVSGIDVPIDSRSHTVFRAITPTLSEPFILQGIELGFDSESELLAAAVYRAQEARHDETGIETMVSEDHIDQAPWFLYSSVYSDGKDWAVLADTGEAFPGLRTVSLKAVFGWDAIYGTAYTRDIRKALTPDLAQAGKGWFAGRYEATGKPNAVLTLNTNAVILEALYYAVHGPLWSPKALTP